MKRKQRRMGLQHCFLPIGSPAGTAMAESFRIVLRSNLLTELGIANFGEGEFKRFIFNDVM